MASRVTMLFASASWSSSSGTAVISFDLPSTQRWPSTRPCSLAQALTTCSADCSRPWSNERRMVLPSMATTSRSNLSASEPTQAVNPASNASGSISMNTRRNVSCEGMPFGKSRNVLSQASLLRPYSAMSSQLSAQAITAQTAITSTSTRRCSTLPGQRGSSTATRYWPSFSIDMPRSPATARARHHTSGRGRREKSHA
jgi:hypothetical protein